MKLDILLNQLGKNENVIDKIKLYDEVLKIIKAKDINISDYEKIIKSFKWKVRSEYDRLIEYLYHRINIFKFYPSINQSDFYENLYKKKEFYINKYDKFNFTSKDDPQEILCPSQNKKFKNRPHQIFLKNYL